MPVITCAQPGCSTYIHYDKDDIEVPLYCQKHRGEGRHSRVRVLHKPILPNTEDPKVIMRCINADCHYKLPVLKSDWMDGIRVPCPMCSGKMLYHGDVNATQ